MARLIYGIHPIEALLHKRSAGVQGLLVADKSPLKKIIAAAEAQKITVQSATSAELDALAGKEAVHQGVVAIVGDYAYWTIEDLLEKSPPDPLLIVLDSILDPHNLGAIIRSAYAQGADGLIIPKDRAAQINQTVVKVSAGATEQLPCARETNLVRTLEKMKERGFWIVGSVETGGQPPEAVNLCGPLALIVGNEQKGIRPLVQKQCDLLVTIPTRASLASLNASAAAAVLIYEAARQRRDGKRK